MGASPPPATLNPSVTDEMFVKLSHPNCGGDRMFDGVLHIADI